ncbi:hypothetical protein CF54_19835 [Streptomyces sp. Tu 6176]|nr:hypothetical protein CF54_19835 [Streptomyces sp. Tu 6176]
MMMWALVPLMPKEEMAARRGWSVWGQGRASVRSRTVPSFQSTCVVGSVTCRVRGRMPWRMAWVILMSPPIPAAACECPMLDFSEPRYRGCSVVCAVP